MNVKKQKVAFSLAEALITLLVVCLITLASIPILTKKKRDLSSEHGRWMCTLNSSGEYVTWTKGVDSADPNNPDAWQKTNKNECVFVAPAKARNFAIKALGAGGGGAAGEFIAEDKYAGGSSFNVSQESDYRVLLIGGGGGGGSKTNDHCDRDRFAHGGGTGAIYEGLHKFYPGVNYSVSQGDGGTYSDDDNDDGGNSGAKANDGSASSVTSNSGGNLYLKLVAGGGTGGRNYIKDGAGSCKMSDYDAGGETGGSYTVEVGHNSVVSAKTGVNGREVRGSETVTLSEAASFIVQQTNILLRNTVKRNDSSSTTYTGYGFGGYAGGGNGKDFDRGVRDIYSSCEGSERCWGQQGGAGLVKIYEFASYIGNAGKAGDAENQFVPSFEGKPVSVKIGRPGVAGRVGAPEENLSPDGGKGGNTYVSSLVATGGDGGVSRKTKITKEVTEQVGNNGERSHLNSDENAIGGAAGTCNSNSLNFYCNDALSPAIGQYGAGGGSGSAGYRLIHGSNVQKTGHSDGAQGAPGVVIIEW